MIKIVSHAVSFCVSLVADFIALLLQLQTDTSLFVASAANQMLAHILLFFQPQLSAACNGLGEKNRDGQRTEASITDINHSGVTMETSPDYTAVVTATSKYLKDSLVPKEKTRLHRSLQTLKLLSVLLAQAGPRLREQLLRTVADPLEELVTAGHSQLTLPLMDIVLAAHRYTDSPTAEESCKVS